MAGLITTAAAVRREEGTWSLIKKGIHRTTFNHALLGISPGLALGTWDRWHSVRNRYHQLRRRRAPERYTDADPNKRFTVSPDAITYRFASDEDTVVDRDHYRGLVSDGSWDRNRVRITDRTFYRSIAAVYDQGHDWAETPWYQDALEAIDSGGRKWGCGSRAELGEQCAHVDRLYAAMDDHGYISQRDLVAQGLDQFPLRDPVLSIGRDGELLHFNDGNHRLALSKLLEVDEITVRIGIRHAEWQRLRNTLRETGPESLDPAERTHLEHPDLADLLEDSR
ncbi:hypothetical protein [Natronolimnobius baerhuensis]|uniref:ParB/Sulfiredoxin domain-containing protein n=1 Tax=Natronolimnobius baerhuensis TaxID=253108 RepID=A0A202EA75_9EURY|nr:hypothetical protein [Natronolimnobius baerhuensis]OVE85151.1 hypothetical protein B2G88_12480 [Natronolimnobius baerhuensis]